MLKTVEEKEKEKILSQTIGDQRDSLGKATYTELLSKASNRCKTWSLL